LFGFMWGLFPFLEDFGCGDQPVLGDPFCTTFLSEDWRIAAVP